MRCDLAKHFFRGYVNTAKTNPCFKYEGKTAEERNLVIFKDTPMNDHILMESSRRDLFIDMVVVFIG